MVPVFRIIICLHAILPFQGNAQNSSILFKHFKVEDGLSYSNVTSILHHSKGFMWFGTSNGLNKFDGYNFIVYKNDPETPSSLSDNNISDLIEDREGDIWIATYKGLNKYNRKTNDFISYTHDPVNSKSLVSNPVQCLLEDSRGNFWVGNDGGLNKFDRKTNSFIRYTHNVSDSNTLSNNDVSSIIEDRTGRLWVGTRGGGVDLFIPSTGKFIHHGHNRSIKTSLGNNFVLDLFEDSHNNFWVATQKGLFLFDRLHKSFARCTLDNKINFDVISSLSEDSEGNLWVGTENDGVYIYNDSKKTFANLKNGSDPSSLSNNSIYSIYKDGNRNMWIGTYSGGVNVFNANQKKFSRYRNIPGDGQSLSHNSVLTLAEDEKGVWIGTDGGGLNFFDKDQKVSYQSNSNFKNPQSPSGNYVVSVLRDKQGNLWSSTWGDGVNMYSEKRKTFSQFKNHENDFSSISSNYCFEIFEDREGTIWVGTLGGGLNRLNSDGKTFTRYLPDPTDKYSISSKWIYTIFEDSRNNLWVGTEDMGLNLLNRNTNQFTHFFREYKQRNSLSDNTINVMLEDNQGNLWIGTNSGLNKFDYYTKTFKVYLEKHGLPANGIKSLELDKRGNIWIGTIRGLSKFNPSKEIFKNYTVSDGLQGFEFSRQASLKTKNGEMYFGGNNGFNKFHPDSISDNKLLPPVVIKDFLIFNKHLTIGDNDSPLKEHINETSKLVLNYNQSVFSIEFAALEFINPQQTNYAYMLDGFEKDWNYIGNKRSATYTKLDPGEYTFKVKASNGDGVWNEKGATLKIIVTPPYWKTWWFKILVGGCVIAIFYGIVRIRFRMIKKININLETKVRQKTAEIVSQKEALEAQQTIINHKNHSLEKLINEQENLLDEKEWLIKEIHHRVKNNLHTIMSLLDSQTAYLKNSGAKSAIRDAQHRIQAMSLLHQKLYLSKEKNSIDMSFYIRELIVGLKDSFDTGEWIHFEIDVQSVVLKVSQAVTIALILNEAITNALKYAFPQKHSGAISICLNETSPHFYTLSIGDNGIGLPPDFHVLTHASLGLNLIQGFTKDIGGTFTIVNDSGTIIRIDFPYDHETLDLEETRQQDANKA